MVMDYRHATEEGQRLKTRCKRWSETEDRLKEVVRDCRGGQRLHKYYRRWWETIDIMQERVIDFQYATGDSQRL